MSYEGKEDAREEVDAYKGYVEKVVVAQVLIHLNRKKSFPQRAVIAIEKINKILKKDVDFKEVLESNIDYVDMSFGNIEELIKTIDRFLDNKIGDEGPDVCNYELFNEASKKLQEYVLTSLEKLSPIIVREKQLISKDYVFIEDAIKFTIKLKDKIIENVDDEFINLSYENCYNSTIHHYSLNTKRMEYFIEILQIWKAERSLTITRRYRLQSQNYMYYLNALYQLKL